MKFRGLPILEWSTEVSPHRVSIRPGISILSVLRHLNYRPWFALAEFVDNALQSYLSNADKLRVTEGAAYKLHVSIQIDPDASGNIVIRDNAAGIAVEDFPRAFRPAELPIDRSGFCEFGMGMKSAACWFSPQWQVRTKSLNDKVERMVTFDIARIIDDQLEELEVEEATAPENSHFTEVRLLNIYRLPVTRTIAKVKEHLTDIYRCFLRDGSLELDVNGELLSYVEPEILRAPFYREPGGTPVLWRKDFSLDLGCGLKAEGFAAIRKVASTSRAGFALFRRKRLIQGSGDDGYRPEMIFGSPNTFPYQRVFGEIHLEGFEVSHTKDGFKWDANEEPFIQLLRDELNDQVMPLLQQAREFRVQRTRGDLRAGAEAAVNRTSDSLQAHAPPVITGLTEAAPPPTPPISLPQVTLAAQRVFDLPVRGERWTIRVELTDDVAVGDWLEFGEQAAASGADRTVSLRMSLVHPFMQRFAGATAEEIEPLLRLAVAIGLGEVLARNGGARFAGAVRRNVNELLRSALCHS
jgi:hypothetical protein